MFNDRIWSRKLIWSHVEFIEKNPKDFQHNSCIKHF